MGCTAGKLHNKSSNNQLDTTDIKKKNSGNTLYYRHSSASYYGSSALNSSCTQEFGINKNKRGTLQVDYINDPNQSDQITAKITRSSPSTSKKRSIDQGSWSPNVEKLKVQRVKQQAVGIVQEKSECEEQGTNHNLYKVNQELNQLTKQLAMKACKSNENMANIHQIQIQV